MFSINETQTELVIRIASSMELVDRSIAATKDFLTRSGIDRFSEIVIVLRELFINAVEHGNQRDVKKHIEVFLSRISDRRFALTVRDEGPGVDPNRVNRTMPQDPAQERNRGFALIHAFSDEIRFDTNPTAVTAWVTIPEDSRFSHATIGDWEIIRPTGDITAAVAEDLRCLLVKVLDSGGIRFRFDLSETTDVDSIGLSLLISFARLLTETSEGGELEIHNATSDLKTLFEMIRLDRIYRIAPTTNGDATC